MKTSNEFAKLSACRPTNYDLLTPFLCYLHAMFVHIVSHCIIMCDIWTPTGPQKTTSRWRGSPAKFWDHIKDQWIRQLWLSSPADSTPAGLCSKNSRPNLPKETEILVGSNTSIDLSSQALKATSMIRTNICTYMYIYILYIIQFCSSHISCFCFLMCLCQRKRTQRASEQLGYSKCTTVWHDWISSCSGKGWHPATHCDCGDEFSGSKSPNGSTKQVACWQLPVGLSRKLWDQMRLSF